MNHQEALRMQAPERYALGELSSSELEEFEEHFFTCAECAEDLSVGAIFAANARAVFREQSLSPTTTSPVAMPQRGGRWWNWLQPATAMPLAAAVALLCVVGYQNAITIPGLKSNVSHATAPQSAPSYALKIARGDEAVVVPANARSFVLTFFLPRQGTLPQYTGEIETAAGAKVGSFALQHPVAGQPFTIVLQRTDFSSGSYLLKVYTSDTKAEIATYHFDLKVD